MRDKYGREHPEPDVPITEGALAFTATKGSRQLLVHVVRDLRGWELRASEDGELRRSQVAKTAPDFERLLQAWSGKLAADGWTVADAD